MDTVFDVLTRGRIQMEGQVTWGSNYTFLVQVCHEDESVSAIYKPQRGERPLWDFPTGTLCYRERAAYLLSQAVQWPFVPPTLLREGPYGLGSLQLFVEHDPQEHYLTFKNQFADQAQRIALFDYIVNNADRKSGHLLRDEDDLLWAIDHGVCFHEEYKLRTVIWEFAETPIPQQLQDGLAELDSRLTAEDDPIAAELQTLLTPAEFAQMGQRLQKLRRNALFPAPGSGRPYPWPLI
jgi:hypothetical protein